jgi:hypothetical protein
MSNRQSRARQVTALGTPPENFDSLIERAASFLAVASSSEIDEVRAQELYQQAMDCMIRAARSPFFGGTKTTVSYEGLTVVREEVFERVSDKLLRWGYQI